MITKGPEDTAPLRRLWQQAFGDSEEALDHFFAQAYSPDRCRCLYGEGRLGAMLFWFTCTLEQQKIAYLYAVATEAAMQRRGLCRKLMEDTHRHLRQQGYTLALLVPGSPDLFRLYEKMGYRTVSTVRKFTCPAGEIIPLRQIGPEEYAALRRHYLPPEGVVQEGAVLRFLRTYSAFYAGEHWVLAGTREQDRLRGWELLGDPKAAPGIVAALGCREGSFRTPGGETPFAMAYPLADGPVQPLYFGLAMD